MNRSTTMLIILAVIVSICAAIPACADTWNPATDFPTAWAASSATYGPWSIGYAATSSLDLSAGYTFGLMTGFDNSWGGMYRMNGIPGSDQYGMVSYNPNGTDDPNTGMAAYGIGLHPGSNAHKPVVRFTAPSTGLYLVDASMMLYWIGQATPWGGTLSGQSDAHIVKYVNSTHVQDLASAILNAGNQTLTLVGYVGLNAGESLDFVVGEGGNTYEADLTRLAVTISSAGSGGTVSGTVSGPSGAVAGATVSIVGGTGSTSTDVNGSYSLILPSGTYTLKASKGGYKAQQLTNVVVSDGATTTKNFTLTIPNWQQVGSNYAGPYTTADWVATSFTNPIDNMPVDLAVAGSAMPNMKVTYTVNGYGAPPWYYGNQFSGRHGLVLYATATPSISDGLYSGYDGYQNSYWGPICAMTGTPTGPSGAWIFGVGEWQAAGNPVVTFDITQTVIDGVATSSAVWAGSAMTVPTAEKSYTISAADAVGLNGQTKFAVFSADAAGANSTVTNIKFYKDPDQVLPHGTIQGTVILNGSTPGAGAIVATTDGSYSAIADSAGSYSLGLPPGSYTLRASKNGFAPQTEGPISLADGQTVTQNFGLTGPNWVQAAPTVATTYSTPDMWDWPSGGAAFSQTGLMPITLEAGNGTVPNMKVTYALTTTGAPNWGSQPVGNGGLALFVDPSAPSASSGLFTGVSHPSYTVSAGAIAGNYAQIPAPQVSFPMTYTYNVTVEVVGGTAWTTLENENTGTYTVTSIDATNWTGKLGFAAFKSSPPDGIAHHIAYVSNITFYRDANQSPVNASFIQGHVTAANLGSNPPIAGARVVTLGDDSVTTYTDASGYYEMTVRPGDYVIRTYASGYTTAEPEIHVNAGQTLIHDQALTHNGKWELSDDYSTGYNPNGQWSYGYSPLITDPFVPYGQTSSFGFMEPAGAMSAWTKDAVAPNAWYAWLGKNTSGAPVTWSVDGQALGYIENNEMSFGGGGLGYNYAMGYAAIPRIRWTAPDERMVRVYFKIAGQSPVGGVGYVSVVKNNSPAAVRGYDGFVGRAAGGYTDAVGPAPTATFETQLLVTTGDTIDFAQGVPEPYVHWAGYFGYPWRSMAIWATIENGTAVVCNSWDELKSKNVGDIVYMKAPVQLASATNDAGSFVRRFGDTGTMEPAFYIQNADRTQGIKCVSDGGLTTYGPTYKIVFTGKVEADPLNAGKKIIRMLSINSAVHGTEPAPIGKSNKALANTGTLVRVWGKITSKTVNPNAASDLWDADPTEGVNMVPKYDYEYITIDDGSVAGGIKILMHVQANYMTNVDGTIGGLSVGDYVGVTGIASTTNGTDVVVAPRNVGDILEYVP